MSTRVFDHRMKRKQRDERKKLRATSNIERPDGLITAAAKAKAIEAIPRYRARTIVQPPLLRPTHFSLADVLPPRQSSRTRSLTRTSSPEPDRPPRPPSTRHREQSQSAKRPRPLPRGQRRASPEGEPPGKAKMTVKKPGPIRTPAHARRWRCGESNSGPKQIPDRCLQAQSPVGSRRPRTR